MTPDVCEAAQVHGFEGVGLPACRELGSGRPLAYNDALDAAPTCAVPALAIARDAGCEGGIYAIEDGDGAGTCQEVA